MYKNRPFYYETCCVHAQGDDINEMTEQALEITWPTFIRHVPVESVREIFSSYSYRGEMCPFHIKDDWAVSFWRSRYRDQRCYYIEHSRIEYIWTRLPQKRRE